MRSFLFLSLAALAITGCSTITTPDAEPYQEEVFSSERRNVGYVDIGDEWRLESEALTVTRDESQKQVLRAGAQLGARLTSLRLPHHTQVPTSVTAEAIYYDAFQDRFECVGFPVIRQGAKLTERAGADARLVMHSDGTIKKEIISSLVADES
jgi:hypothetical protein